MTAGGDVSETRGAFARPPLRRLGWAAGLVVAGNVVAPMAEPSLAVASVSSAWRALSWTACMLALPQLSVTAAAAVLGSEGCAWLKGCVLRLIRRHAPPARVSRTRYRVGLVLFGTPLILGWLAAYLPDLGPNRLAVAVGADMLLLISLFVLGGTFWEKLHALFLYDGKVVVETRRAR